MLHVVVNIIIGFFKITENLANESPSIILL